MMSRGPPPEGRPCSICGKPIPAGAESCEHCEGSKSSRIAAGDAPSMERKLHETERRQVTVLNCGCELEDAETSLSALDPEDQHELLVDFRQSCREVVARLGGTVAVATPQGLQACFGFPVAHEDAARRAVDAGLAILGKVRQLNDRLHQTRGVGLVPWAAIHSGPAIVGDLETGEGLSIIGEAPSVATRMEHVVEPGWLAITEATRRLVEGYFTSEPLGARAIRGLPRPIELHRITGRGDAASRIDVARSVGLSPLTGRDQEVGLLKDRWEHAKEDVAQLVQLGGEAGIGKSRLVLVLKEFVADDEPGRAAAILEWRCSPHYQDSGLYPATDCLERILRLRPTDPPSARLDKLEEHLKVLRLDDPERLALFASLLSIPTEGRLPDLGLSPQRQKEKTLEALVDWLAAQAQRRPVLFIVEDMHWVDPSTLEFLALLLDQRPDDRLMTVLTARPEFTAPWPMRANRCQIAINRLTRRQIADLVRRKVGLKDVPAEVVEQLAARTDGVPLFIEEFARMLEESGQLRGEAGELSLTGSFPLDTIPATLHDLLLSRLDRMPGVKDVAQLGASLGREFSHELIRAVSPLDEATLRRELVKLIEAEILFEKGRPPRTTYLFKHALIQDAAYQSMIKPKRQQVHERIARVLEDGFSETARSQPELLAHHYSSAGMAREAIAYWREAGGRSQARSAHAEAIGHIARGLEQVATAARIARPRRDRAGLPGRPVGLAGRLPGLRLARPGVRPRPGQGPGRADRRHRHAVPDHLGDVGPPPAPRRDGHRHRPRQSVARPGRVASRQGADPRRLVLDRDHPVLPGGVPRRPRRLRPLLRAGGAGALPVQRPQHQPGHRRHLPLLPGARELVHGPARRRLGPDQRGGRVHPRGRPPVQPGLRPAPCRLGLVPLPTRRRRHPVRRRVPGDLGRAGVPVLEGAGDDEPGDGPHGRRPVR